MVGKKLRIFFCLFCMGISECFDLNVQIKSLLNTVKNLTCAPELFLGISLAEEYNLIDEILSTKESLTVLKTEKNSYHNTLENNLRSLENKFHDLSIEKYDVTDDPTMSIIVRALFAPTQFTGERGLRYKRLKKIQKMNFEDYIKIVDQGLPSGKMSDQCWAELVSTGACVISESCLRIVTANNNNSFGYHKTHQLLYMLMMAKYQCSNFFPPFISSEALLQRKCEEVWEENRLIAGKSIPKYFQDLYLEQVLLCVLAGFSEFLSEIMVEPILKLIENQHAYILEPLYDGKNLYSSHHLQGLEIAFLGKLIKETVCSKNTKTSRKYNKIL